jgi:hypothetical protein
MLNVISYFNFSKAAAFVFVVFFPFPGRSQTLFTGLESLFATPKNYTTAFTPVAPEIDGDIRDKIWEKAGWSDLFQDIQGGKMVIPAHNTRFKMLWDKSCLYIAAEIQEPHVWAKLLEHDEVIYYDNDFEVFIDPDNNTHQYFEIELNALNTIFDLFLLKPYRDNGSVLNSWDAPGMRSAIKVQGTLNKPSDIDKGWTVEMAIPFKSLSLGTYVKIPKEGDLWRINFSRVQWDTEIISGQYIKKKDLAGKNLPENNWVWSPQGIINMHYPERWGYLQFTMKDRAEDDPGFELPYAELQKKYLWLVYYRQKEYYSSNKTYATSLNKLGIDEYITIAKKENHLKLEATGSQFRATIAASEGKLITINNEGLIQ